MAKAEVKSDVVVKTKESTSDKKGPLPKKKRPAPGKSVAKMLKRLHRAAMKFTKVVKEPSTELKLSKDSKPKVAKTKDKAENYISLRKFAATSPLGDSWLANKASVK